ncbi:ABC transporter permease [Synechocystis sp. LKSZ1]|uniref:ABC transporter permease n=1 Tax=Synechocystis sp. LKSZ1 TaxID=3144951 RepID=UPI00336BC8C9
MSNSLQFWQSVQGVAQRVWWELLHRKRSLLFWLVFPLVVLLLNGIIFADRAELELSEALQFAAPASLVGAAFFFSCLGGSVAIIVAEREQNTLKRLLITPLSGGAYFAGIYLALGGIALLQTLAVLILVYLLGAPYQGNWGLGLAILVLSVAAYVGAGFILGTQLARRTEDVNALVATLGLPLMILGGAFFPSSIFPKSLLAIARYNPVYHMTEALTQVWAEGKDWPTIQGHLQFLAIFTVFMILGGWLAYQRVLAQERRR